MAYKFLILGLLADRPMSGYDIKKQVKLTLGAITSASYGTLYPTLHKLLSEACVQMEEVPQRSRPSKKVYYITDKGRADLKEWLKQPALADQIRREFLLKLYLSKNLGEQELLSIISNRLAETAKVLKALEADRKNANTTQQGWVVDYALRLCEAEVKWLEQFEAQLSGT
jgi:PadR family transcriptional regulator, regulatory protein AphA